MNIRSCPEYIPFLEGIITFIELFPTDLVLYGIMQNVLEIPDTLRLHIRLTNGENTRAAWLKIFQWSLDTYPFQQVKERMHDAMQRAGMILRYRVFIRDYNLYILRPESQQNTPKCFPFFCFKKKRHGTQ